MRLRPRPLTALLSHTGAARALLMDEVVQAELRTKPERLHDLRTDVNAMVLVIHKLDLQRRQANGGK